MDTTEAAKRIEMTFLRKSGDLNGWSWRRLSWTYMGEPSGSLTAQICTGSDGNNFYMELDYRTRSWSEEEWRQMKYKVILQSTPCRYGGRRWWFICPNTHCRRRNSILYQSGDYFVCRKCAHLKYASQEYSGKFNMLHNLYDIEDYERTMKRWYYRGKPTRKHRRLIKMTRGMNESEMLNACLAMLQAK
jgi:hypothetical protein